MKRYTGFRLPPDLDVPGEVLAADADFFMCKLIGKSLFDYDAIFDRYKQKTGFDGIIAGAGMRTKSRNTIVKEWPARLSMQADETEIARFVASGDEGWARYVEWVLADDDQPDQIGEVDEEELANEVQNLGIRTTKGMGDA